MGTPPPSTPSAQPSTEERPTADIERIGNNESSRPVPMEPLRVVEPGGEMEAGPRPDGTEEPVKQHISGWRLYLLTFALCLALFLSSLETSIVSTSLISITNALGGFDQRDWIVTSYLLTYTGFLIIYAKFSDILGRKAMILLALGLFFAFSIGCGLAANMIQLIILRAFQGIGASGIYAMVSVINPEMVPPQQWGNIVAVISLVYVLSSTLGPILGGLISEHSTWRWVFLLNPPAASVSVAIILFLLPSRFPNPPTATRSHFWDQLSWTSFRRLDLVGAFLLLAFSILLVFGFEEAGIRYPWASPVIIAPLTLGGILVPLFVVYEKFVVKQGSSIEPMIPLRLFRGRAFVGLVLTAFFTGPPFMTVLINLPQRFQAVDGLSPFDAGIHVLPVLLSSPLATAITSQLISRLNVPPFYLMVSGATIQLLGVGLCSMGKPGNDPAIWGYEVVMGFGFGMTLVTILVYIPFTVKKADLAVTMGVMTQVRVLSGTIGLAISATVLNNRLSARLPLILDPTEIAAISDSVDSISLLPSATRAAVRETFNDAYNLQLQVMLPFAAVALAGAGLLWERKLRRAKDIEGY